MNKKFKRIHFIMAVTCALTLLPAAPVPVHAKTTEQTITANQTYGNLSTKNWDDEYLFHFQAPSDGYFVVEVTNTEAGNTEHASLTVFNDRNQKLYWGRETTFSSAKFPTSKGNSYLLKLDHADSTHSLRVVFTQSKDWESGKNSSAQTATPLQSGKDKYGILDDASSAFDQGDYYRFNVSQLSKATFLLGPAEITGSSTSFYAEIINAQNQTERLFNSDSATQIKEAYLKKGTYYIKVSGGTALPYKFRVNLKKANLKKVNIRKIGISGRKKGLLYDYRSIKNLSIKGYGDVQGYNLMLANDKKFRTCLYNDDNDLGSSPNSDTASTIRQLNGRNYPLKKTYYFRVRPYIYDVFGTKVYAPFSASVKKKF
ncbi:hypothetical protein SAMN02910400_01252 [Lachnospiraceae bacterium C10]|nr:hypothetical protein SAMN02910400_01252 [Lachnospiraceae bacterium C10]